MWIVSFGVRPDVGSVAAQVREALHAALQQALDLLAHALAEAGLFLRGASSRASRPRATAGAACARAAADRSLALRAARAARSSLPARRSSRRSAPSSCDMRCSSWLSVLPSRITSVRVGTLMVAEPATPQLPVALLRVEQDAREARAHRVAPVARARLGEHLVQAALALVEQLPQTLQRVEPRLRSSVMLGLRLPSSLRGDSTPARTWRGWSADLARAAAVGAPGRATVRTWQS